MISIQRVVIECVHGLNIKFLNNMDKLNNLIACNQKFPNLNFNVTTNYLRRTSNDNMSSILVDSNRVIIDIQNDSNIDEIYKDYMEVMNTLIRNFGINSFTRVGIRSFIKDHKSDVDNIGEIILNNFINLDNVKCNEYGEGIIDIRFGFTTKYGQYKINHNFFKQVDQDIKINRGKSETKTKYSIVYDIDFFKDTPSLSNDLEQIFKDAKEKLNISSKKFFSAIGDEQ